MQISRNSRFWMIVVVTATWLFPCIMNLFVLSRSYGGCSGTSRWPGEGWSIEWPHSFLWLPNCAFQPQKSSILSSRFVELAFLFLLYKQCDGPQAENLRENPDRIVKSLGNCHVSWLMLIAWIYIGNEYQTDKAVHFDNFIFVFSLYFLNSRCYKP